MHDVLLCGIWNDQNGIRPQAPRATKKTLYHYVIVRADLPRGVQAAQIIHAAGESCVGPVPEGTFAIALHARDEAHLHDIKRSLWDAEVPHVAISEPDAPYGGQMMAIGLFPTDDRSRVRTVTSSLPLVR